MPWVRLTDDWYDDEDLIEAGPAAMLLWPVLISWSLRNLQDGKVPSGQVRRLVDWTELGIDPAPVIASLVAVGRLQEIAGGYLIVNFLKYQPSKEKVLADREKDRQRKAAGRSDPPPDVRPESVRNPSLPDPVPDPDVESSSSSSSSDAVPDEVWAEVARKKLAAAKNVGNPTRWLKTVIANAKADSGADAAWIWETYQITPSHLADIIVTGNRSSLANLPKRQDDAA